MSASEKAAKAAAMHHRAKQQVRDMAESPDIAKSVVGAIVLDMIRLGDEISFDSITLALEAVSKGLGDRAGINDLLASGALKVMADLRR